MIDLIAKEYLPWGSRYLVSPDGYVQTALATPAGPAGRFLMPRASSHCAIYTMVLEPGEPSRSIPVAKAIAASWGAHGGGSYLDVLEDMRAAIKAHNMVHFPDLHKADEARRLNGRGKSGSAHCSPGAGTDNMPCPWASGKITDRDLLGADIMLGFAL